jgi:hypothetical protein
VKLNGNPLTPTTGILQPSREFFKGILIHTADNEFTML